MATPTVYTGADGSITLSTPEGAEGEAAQNVLDEYDLVSVGRVQDVKVEVHSSIRAYHEIGQRYATELRPGNIEVHGTIQRAYINGALLKLMLGEASSGRPAGSWAQPAFNITLLAQNPAASSVNNTITLHDVKLSQWDYHMPEDDFVMDNIRFQALYLTVEDAVA